MLCHSTTGRGLDETFRGTQPVKYYNGIASSIPRIKNPQSGEVDLRAMVALLGTALRSMAGALVGTAASLLAQHGATAAFADPGEAVVDVLEPSHVAEGCRLLEERELL